MFSPGSQSKPKVNGKFEIGLHVPRVHFGKKCGKFKKLEAQNMVETVLYIKY